MQTQTNIRSLVYTREQTRYSQLTFVRYKSHMLAMKLRCWMCGLGGAIFSLSGKQAQAWRNQMHNELYPVLQKQPNIIK